LSKPLLLWVDCTSGLPDAEPRVRAASCFEIAQVRGTSQAAAELARLKPHALCFDFDYPDQTCLQAMQAIKQSHPRLPILMLTFEHSESLAVWAFRARVWNYLVKPVSLSEFAENLNALANLGVRASPPRAAQLLRATVPSDLPVQAIPANVARLQPALHYVTQHYHERISASVAARSCGLSRFDFSRKFRAAFGTTFREYLLRVRVTEARRMLTEGRVSITGIAYSVGLNDGSHFARLFRRLTGALPSEYLPQQALAERARLAEASAASAGMLRRASDRSPAQASAG
jgi:YesN/AraC family two-component response regulator